MEGMMLGGNQVKRFSLGSEQVVNKVVFATCAYHYSFVSLYAGANYAEEHLNSFTILCLTAEDEATLEVAGKTYALKQGDAALLENHRGMIKANVGNVTLLIAGVLNSYTQESIVTVIPASNHKKVTKPWGHEIWFNGEHPGYCLKEVMIKAGFRTSLQYHRFKEETNVLLRGTANLVYKKEAAIANDEVNVEHLGVVELAPLSVVHVTPDVLHRLEAQTDVLLYETSTPYLDDVIRVQDDKLRGHGRVVAEHAT